MNHPLPNTLVLLKSSSKPPMLSLLTSLNNDNTVDVAVLQHNGTPKVFQKIPYQRVISFDWNKSGLITSKMLDLLSLNEIRIVFEGAIITPIHFYTYNGFRVLYGCHATQGFITIYTDEVTFHLKSILALPRS